MVRSIVIASTSKVRGNLKLHLDCFVAMLLAKTEGKRLRSLLRALGRNLDPFNDALTLGIRKGATPSRPLSGIRDQVGFITPGES